MGVMASEETTLFDTPFTANPAVFSVVSKSNVNRTPLVFAFLGSVTLGSMKEGLA